MAGLTALVGREEEIELLMRRWSRADGGEGQVVVLAGEAGIGKSRLTAALMDNLGGVPHTRVRSFCSAQRTDSALYPVIAQFERAAGFAHDDPPEVRLDKLDALLAQTATPPEARALLAELLSLPNDGRYPELKLSAPQRRQRTLQALIAQMEALSGHSPVLMIFEDAHWTDPTSLELLGRIVDRIVALPVLLVVTARPEFNAPWIGRPHVTAMTLNRLVQRDAGAIIDSVVGSETLPADIRRAIIERTDGIPLFVEEMTKAVLEAGSESDTRRSSAESSALAVPASLHASLMARLDRLGLAKEIVQVGAAIGREFSHALLAAAAGKSESELCQALDRIVEAGLMVRQGMPPQAAYLFKHALVQDAAYGMLLREPRRALHARIAQALETEFADTAEAEPEILARHFSRADLADQAARSFERAADRAAARSAYSEAISHFSAALAQLERLPGSEERSRRELAVLLKQGPAVLVLMGLRNTDVERIYRRAYNIAHELADEHGLFKALWGLWFFANLGRRTDVARERVAELVLLGQRSGDEALLLEAIHCRWSTAFFCGDVTGIIDSVRDGLNLYDREKHSRLGAEFGGHDPGVCAYTVRGTAFAQRGDRRQAIENVERGVELARALNQPSSEIFAMMNALYTYQMLGDRDAVLGWASKMIELANRFELPAQRSIATFLLAWARACDGNFDSGLKAMEAEFDRVSRLGPIPGFYTGLMARMRLEAGQAAPALELLDDILKTVREPGIGIYVPEIHRLRGESLLRLDTSRLDEAVQEFEMAIRTAKKQGARIFQLAAALSLARASAAAGRPANGVVPLRQAVEAFGEDSDAPQLAPAREWLAAHS
jgi:predicted ATPase